MSVNGTSMWISQFGAVIGAAFLLGDTTAHAFGIGLALFAIMPVIKA